MTTVPRKFPNPSVVWIFGGSQILLQLAKWLVSKDYVVRIFTSPRHEREPMLGSTLGLLLRKEVLFYSSVEELPDDLHMEIGQNDMGFGLGQAWGFSPEIVAAFGGRLLDVMAIPLPRYLGRAHVTHMILRRDRSMGCSLQEITVNTDQGKCHDGLVFEDSRFVIPETCRKPADYFEHMDKMVLNFIRDFLLKVESGATFFGDHINMKHSMFLPGLKTDMHGFIDWSWRGYDILSFIDAFDSPYAGAVSRINGHIVHLKDATLEKETSYHPFHSGLVTRITDDGVFIATTTGHLIVKSVKCGEHNAIPWISPGDRFVNESKDLDEAKWAKAEFYAK